MATKNLTIKTDKVIINRKLVKHKPGAKKQKKDDDRIKDKNIDNKKVFREFSGLINILECNYKENKRHININYFQQFNNQKIFFSQKINYSCNNANCKKCKSRKTKEYITNRFIDSDNIYFITVSTDIELNDLTDSDIKKFKNEISNVFDFLGFPYIAVFEIGSNGLKMHSHIVLFDSNKRSIYITDFLKLSLGYYVNSEIVNIENKGNEKINKYISKISKYISKINKDNDDNFIDSESFIILDKNIYDIVSYSDDIRKNIESYLNKIDFVDSERFLTFSQNMIDLKSLFGVGNIDNDKYATYYFLSYIWNRYLDRYNKVFSLLKDKYYKSSDIEILNSKISRFNQKQLKILLTHSDYFLKLFDFFNNNILKKEVIGSEIKIYSNLFITSIFKKRIISNISIKSIDKSKMIKYSSEFQNKEIKEYIDFYNIADVKKEKQDIDSVDFISDSITNIEYSINNRKYRIESKIYNMIINNTIKQKNKMIKHLTSQQKSIVAKAIDYKINDKSLVNIYLTNYIKFEIFDNKNITKDDREYIKNSVEFKMYLDLKLKEKKEKMIKQYEKLYTNEKTTIKQLPFQ